MTENNVYLDRKIARRICLAEGSLGQVTTKKKSRKKRETRKAPGALDPAVVLPPPGGV